MTFDVKQVSTLMALTAGVVSFLSPCVLPLVPGYISYISGVSVRDLSETSANHLFFDRQRFQVLMSAVLFVFGFSIVFILLGASATWLGSLVTTHLTLLGKISGLIIIFFGILKLGILKTHWFLKDVRFLPNVKKRNGFVSLLLGMTFAFGWTPCVGPILGAILTYAGTVQNLHSGVKLLTIYSAGLGIPFLLTALFIQYFFRFFNKFKKYMGLIERLTGVVLIVMGWLIYSGELTRITSWLTYFNRFSL